MTAARRTRTSPPPRTPWHWALAGALLGGMLTLSLAAPARWLAAAVAQATQGMVQLADAQGTVWNGQARLILTGGRGSRDRITLPGPAHWQLRLHFDGLHLRLHASCCTQPEAPLALHISPRWGGAQVQLHDAQTHWPAALLAGLGTPFNTLALQGELGLHTRQLALDWQAGRLQLHGHADLTLRNMRSRLSTVQPLGSYQVQLQGGEAMSIHLSTLEGALLLNGQGQWIGQRLRFEGQASAAPGLHDQLANLLNLLGRRQGELALISLG